MAKEILIADSERTDQEEFQNIFKTTDYHPIFSESGEEAFLRVKLFKPDLIIGGRDLCEAIKTDQELQDIPFILLSDILDEIPEKDCQRLQANGVISKPLREDQVLNLVDRLMEEAGKGVVEKGFTQSDLDWKSFADVVKPTTEEKGELFLDGIGEEEEEEIIELVDVVEEPEQKMSIEDFVTMGEEEHLIETPSLESWEKEEEERPSEEEFISEEKEMKEEEIPLQIGKDVTPEEPPSDETLFEKIELEEILKKMEQLQPSIEEEWPKGKEGKVLEEPTPTREEPEGKFLGLEEFEAALKREVRAEPIDEEIQPFSFEEQKEEVLKEVTSEEMPIEEELKELPEEEFSETILEDLGEELKELEKEEVSVIEEPEEIGFETLEEEEIQKILEEEISPILMAEEQPIEEVGAVEELKEVEFEKPEEVEISRIFEEPISPPLISVEQPMEEVIPIEVPEEIEITRLEEVEAPGIPVEEVRPPLMMIDRKIEEVISKGVQEMMQDFMIKIIPEVTQNIVSLTMERIEKMVREIIPDLAEKAIQEEIKRLQKGEKD